MILLLSATWTPAAPPIKFDILKTGSRTYTNVTVLGHNATDLYFTHEGGITSVRLRTLDPELQKRFDYDAEAAARAEKQQAEDDARYKGALASNIVAEAQQSALAAKKAAATSQDSLADPVSDKSLLGKPAPSFKVTKWLGSKPVLEGKLLLITFWAPWSVPCRKYVAELNATQRKFGDRLVVLGITSDTEEEIAAMPEPKPDFAVGLDPKARFSAALGVTSIPYLLVVDPRGVVRYQGHPAPVNDRELDRILAQNAE